jgi:hypothetical protein
MFLGRPSPITRGGPGYISQAEVDAPFDYGFEFPDDGKETKKLETLVRSMGKRGGGTSAGSAAAQRNLYENWLGV